CPSRLERDLHLAPPGLCFRGRRESPSHRLSIAGAPSTCLKARQAGATPAAACRATPRVSQEHPLGRLLHPVRHANTFALKRQKIKPCRRSEERRVGKGELQEVGES